jgi:hypothetical protein
MAENLKVFDFTLTEEEMQRIAALKRPDGRIANPPRYIDFTRETGLLSRHCRAITFALVQTV